MEVINRKARRTILRHNLEKNNKIFLSLLAKGARNKILTNERLVFWGTKMMYRVISFEVVYMYTYMKCLCAFHYII